MALSPMMQHYLQVKEENKDCLIFYRLGDFYELFFDDAELVSRELELTLTGRDCGLENRAPMCGVPYHAAEGYIAKLIEKGYKVAICEQLEDPATAKGLVERGITRIITPGTVTDEMLDGSDNSYILCAYRLNGVTGAAYADVSTGAFYVEQILDDASFISLLARISPKETLLSDEQAELKKILASPEINIYTTEYSEWIFDLKNARKELLEHFKIANLTSFGIDDMTASICAAGALIYYLSYTQKNSLMHIKSITPVIDDRFMVIDRYTQRNLELTETLREKKRTGSLLGILDKTKTAMGARFLKNAVLKPLKSKKDICARLDAVDEIKNSIFLRTKLPENLRNIYDMERIISRISYGTLDAKGALSLKQSLNSLPELINTLNTAACGLLSKLSNEIDPIPELSELLQKAISENPPIGIKEGGIIKDGYNSEVDKLRNANASGKEWLCDLEAREREKTGIPKLKVGYNRVFGYYIEVSRSFSDKVPYTYIRKQTLANCERYITEELKDLEDAVLGAREKLFKLEYELFTQIREEISKYINRIQKTAKAVAETDFLCSLAQTAYAYDYCKPKINENGVIDIKDGRHPVVERYSNGGFVSNDAYLDMKDDKLLVITGPNMAGKSTFMRQIGLIVLMAHIGSFVPASSASVCLTDRVFTRVGASDDLTSGQSTFMVEMNELANILNNATKDSLLILDEIGRGTSTTDGLAIAWATIEYILNEGGIGAKTLFATHYHELTDLEGRLKGMRNYSVSIKEFKDSVIFLHKIKRGGTDRSFGIEVARMAGLPEQMLKRASGLVKSLENSSDISLSEIESDSVQTRNEKDYSELISAVKEIDVNNLTPLEALSVLDNLVSKVK